MKGRKREERARLFWTREEKKVRVLDGGVVRNREKESDLGISEVTASVQSRGKKRREIRQKRRKAWE